MKKTLAVVLGTALLVVPFATRSDAVEIKPVVKAPSAKYVPADPNMSRLTDCEDFDIQPCWTLDEGQYRIVYSYDPYRSKRVVLCKAEDGGPKLPCLSKRNNKVLRGEPVTRNYFWRKTF